MKIIALVDGSTYSASVCDHAAWAAKRIGLGVELVHVLGHPQYYREHGFIAAGVHGLQPPYAIAPEHSDAWMVRELRPGVIGNVAGQVVCADALNDPKYWQE